MVMTTMKTTTTTTITIRRRGGGGGEEEDVVNRIAFANLLSCGKKKEKKTSIQYTNEGP